MDVYHFNITFFPFLGVAILFSLPLFISLIVGRVKENSRPIVGLLYIVVSFCTLTAIICFMIALCILSVFSWIPWWAAGILMTIFIIAVVISLGLWEKKVWRISVVFMLLILLLILTGGWLSAWLTHDICISPVPEEYYFYINRRMAGDFCATTSPAPCHTYLTYNTNASTGVIVHFHSTQAYTDPKVHFGYLSGPGNMTFVQGATRYKVDIEVDRYVYYGFLSNLIPDTTYYFTVGDGDNVSTPTFTKERKFRTAPANQDVNFVTGGDISIGTAASTLLSLAASLEPLYISIGGDLAYANGLRGCYPRWDSFLSMLTSNTTTPSGYTLPFITAPGNHEVAGGWAQPVSHMTFYNRYFVHEDLKDRAPEDLPLHHHHYIGKQLLIALDSNVIESPESQVGYLSSLLAAAPPGTMTSALYHVPAYPSWASFHDPHSVNVRTHFVPVFDAYNMTVAFENHDHAYKRTHRLRNSVADPTGTLYLGDGCFGVPSVTKLPSTVGKPYINVAYGKQFFIYGQMNSTGVDFTSYDPTFTAFDSYFLEYNS